MSLILLLAAIVFNSATATEKVVVVDTGLNLFDNRFKHLCPDGHKDFSGTDMTDRFGHGTHVAGIIDKNIGGDYCIVIVKYFNDKKTNTMISFIEALKYAVSLNPKIVNLSMSGGGFDKDEFEIFKNAKNVHFVVSAGNNGKELSYFTDIYPAQYVQKGVTNMTVVGALKNNKRAPYSNFADFITNWESGTIESYHVNGGNVILSGTSQAAAVYTSKLVK